MGNFFISVCILTALINTGTSLTCNKCASLDGTGCLPTEEEACLVNVTTCENALLEIKIQENITTALLSSCTRFPYDCKVPYISFSGEAFSFSFEAKCCDSSNCNTATLTIPQKNITKNGVQCPVCPAAVDATKCDSQGQTMECSGDETQCLFYAGKMLHPDGNFLQMSFRGCVHNEACKETIPPYPESRLGEGFTFQCSPGISETA